MLPNPRQIFLCADSRFVLEATYYLYLALYPAHTPSRPLHLALVALSTHSERHGRARRINESGRNRSRRSRSGFWLRVTGSLRMRPLQRQKFGADVAGLLRIICPAKFGPQFLNVALKREGLREHRHLLV